ncbi:MAG: hypothetical protein ACXIUZ_06675 [Lysobacteraceae bacterium]
MFNLFRKSPSEDDVETLKRALSPGAVTVVSASCCSAGAAQVDEQVVASAREALAAAGLDWPVGMLTVTRAQAVLPRVTRELDAAQAALAGQVNNLFMNHGLSAFPVLLAHQRVVSYGGVPDAALVARALPARQARAEDGKTHAPPA